MKLFISILLFVLFIVSSNAQNCKSKIIVQSDSVSVYVFINDSLITKANNSEIELPDGKYQIKLVGDNKIWNSTIIDDTVTLKNCETKIIKFHSYDQTYISSNPQDAFIFIGDSLIGNTPMFIDNGSKDITLKKSGYSDYNFTGFNSDRHIKVDLQFIGNEKQKSFFSSTAFKILAGTAIILGTASAYFKLKADDTFDEYKLNRDQSLLDETNKYDLISGISFTALQLNIGFIIYKLFAD